MDTNFVELEPSGREQPPQTTAPPQPENIPGPSGRFAPAPQAGLYPANIEPILDEMARVMVRVLPARAILVYLAPVSENILLPFLIAGRLSPPLAERFRRETLDPDTDLLAHLIFQTHAPVVSQAAAADSRLNPSIGAHLQLHRLLAIPILANDLLLGLVIATRQQLAAPFTQEDAETATAIAGAMGLALENVRLYEETHNRLLEGQSLQAITLALLQKLELSEVLEMVCTEAQRLTAAVGSAVALLEEKHWLHIAYQRGAGEYPAGRFSSHEAPLGLAVQNRQPVCINTNAQNLPGERTSLLAIPLKVQSEIIGVLAVTKRSAGFSPENLRLVQLYANQAAIAIEHARLYRQVETLAVVEERQRLSRELHDSVNQSLYGISLYARAASRQLEQGKIEAAQSHLGLLQSTVQESIAEMRRLIFDLRPSSLQQDGLAAALEQRLKGVEERLGVTTGLKVRLDGRLPEIVENELYRIAQEALNNVTKHAHAAQVSVFLVQSGKVVILKIQDDGVGFDPQAPSAGMGLMTIRERASNLNARLNIESQPGEGTTLTIEVTL